MSEAHKILVIIILLSIIPGCGIATPIKIGFVGTLIGINSDTSVSGRNGAILAVEEINQNGGIFKRPIELIVKNDDMNPNMALRADQELIDEGVVAIIGHMTSVMSVAALPLMNKSKMLMISPMSRTEALSYKDDYFIRILPGKDLTRKMMAEHIYRERKIKKVAVIYDRGNYDYSVPWFNDFKRIYEFLGGQVVINRYYSSSFTESYYSLVLDVLSHRPEAVLIIANTNDAASYCQMIRKTDRNIPLFMTGWGATGNIFKYGGPAVEGLVFPEIGDRDLAGDRFQKFSSAYQDRFGDEPTLASARCYETVKMIAQGLLHSKNISSSTMLKRAILRKRHFQGLTGKFTINKYGDAVRSYQIFKINNRQFIKVNQ